MRRLGHQAGDRRRRIWRVAAVPDAVLCGSETDPNRTGPIRTRRICEKIVEKRVKSGRYNSASEVVREALRLLDAHDRTRDAQLPHLHERIDKGLASLDRGEGVDGERFMRTLGARSPARRRRHSAAVKQ